jgi:nucleotide-binding universal stress UspA family protein
LTPASLEPAATRVPEEADMTDTPGTILVGYDYSAPAREAAQVAFALAQRTRARVHAVVVMERRHERQIVEHGDSFFDGRGGTDREATVQRAAKRLQAGLDAELRPLRPSGVELTAVAVRGKPFKELIRAAAEVQAGLIVVGATGVSGLERWVLGSTAERLSIADLLIGNTTERVLRRMPCSVLTVKVGPQ